ncbi:MAG: hypothetical protein ACNA7W_16450 [Pseudomonadales bacterium]
MLEGMDRVVLVAADAAAAGAGWERFLDAQPAGSSRRPALGAIAHHWRLGDGWVEVLVPDGPGIVAEALEARGAHLFAGGFTTADMGAFAAHLDGLRVAPLWDGDRLVLDEAATGVRGLRVFVDRHAPQPPVGLIDTFYELTDLVADASRETSRAALVLGLEASAFQSIVSEPYGYHGTLTLFRDDRLDRLEMITPNRPETTMHRFYERTGGGLYMCFAESGELAEIERRVLEAGAAHTAVPAEGKRDALGAHTLFLHPKTLGGMMLGLSRRSYAWTWSGHPERVVTA